MQTNITGNVAQYCQSIQCQDQLSEYQPSSDAATFCDSSEFIAYSAMPYITRRAGRLRMMKLMVSGMNVPEPMPPRNCIARKALRLGDNGPSRLEVNIST